MRLVLDTNVLITAFIANGVCAELLEHCIRRHTIVMSDFILSEFRETMVGKFKFTGEETEDALKLLVPRMVALEPVTLESPVCRDADDDLILATALAGQCDCIVTGDKDLLVLKRFRMIEIVSPRDFSEYEVRS
jgi:putative PIN family toxin of toxin-antitoxin system